MYEKWKKIQIMLENLDMYVKNATFIKKEWIITKPMVVETKKEIKAVHKRAFNQDADIRNKTQRALEIAERHLKRVRESEIQSDQHDAPTTGKSNELMSQLLAAGLYSIFI